MAAISEDTGTLTLDTYGSFEDLAALSREWDTFVESENGDIYASFDWCRTWWEFYGSGRSLEITLIRCQGALIGILPFFRETLRTGVLPARVIRCVGCDHSVTTANIVVSGGRECEVVTAWARTIGRDWDIIYLGPVAGYDTRAEAIGDAFQSAFQDDRTTFRKDAGQQIVFELPESYDAYLASLSKKERSNIVRRGRQLREEHEVRVRAVDCCDDTDDAYQTLLKLHQTLWKGKGQLGHFGDWPASIEFHRALVKRLSTSGRVIFLEMQVDGDTVISKYCFLFGRRLHTFMTGRDDEGSLGKYGLGAESFAALVAYAINRGVTSVDAMRGYYEYKIRLGGQVMFMKTVKVERAGLWSHAVTGALRAASWILHNVYYRAWFRRISNLPGLSKGPLWASWIRSRF